jgi:hypothetical protein
MVEQHLAKAEQHLADGQAQIDKQQTIIKELEHRGHDSTVAKALLTTMLNVQELHEQHREQVWRELQSTEQSIGDAD